MIEKWGKIKGHENYLVSTSGRIKNSDTGHILKPAVGTNGYLKVTLMPGRKTENIHRLVALTFLQNPNDLPQVNHKDENKLNNNVENLEWCSAKYNLSYGVFKTSRNSPVLQLNRETGKIVRKFGSIKEAAEATKSCYQTISACCRGEKKSAVGFKWQYEFPERARKWHKKKNT